MVLTPSRNTTNPNTLPRKLALSTNDRAFFMAGRQTKTPGVETPKETTTAAQADAALEEILGTPNVKDADPTQNESEVAADALVPVEQFDAVAQQAEQQEILLESILRLESKVDQLLKANGIEKPKKMKWVQGKHGMEQKEIR